MGMKPRKQPSVSHVTMSGEVTHNHRNDPSITRAIDVLHRQDLQHDEHMRALRERVDRLSEAFAELMHDANMGRSQEVESNDGTDA